MTAEVDMRWLAYVRPPAFSIESLDFLAASVPVYLLRRDYSFDDLNHPRKGGTCSADHLQVMESGSILHTILSRNLPVGEVY